jgi:hypothetical protein
MRRAYSDVQIQDGSTPCALTAGVVLCALRSAGRGAPAREAEAGGAYVLQPPALETDPAPTRPDRSSPPWSRCREFVTPCLWAAAAASKMG